MQICKYLHNNRPEEVLYHEVLAPRCYDYTAVKFTSTHFSPSKYLQISTLRTPSHFTEIAFITRFGNDNWQEFCGRRLLSERHVDAIVRERNSYRPCAVGQRTEHQSQHLKRVCLTTTRPCSSFVMLLLQRCLKGGIWIISSIKKTLLMKSCHLTSSAFVLMSTKCQRSSISTRTLPMSHSPPQKGISGQWRLLKLLVWCLTLWPQETEKGI